MSLANTEATGKKYWRSLDELAQTPKFQEWLTREFPEGASEMRGAHSRRNLLKLMAASFGLAGLVACRRPVENILPQAKGVEDLIPGNPMYYATGFTQRGLTTGLIVEAHDARPTKIEGNPKHPASLGAASAYAQASVLNLYDPNRSRAVLESGRRSDWKSFAAFVEQHFTETNLGGGEGVWLLSEETSSPSLEAVRRHFLERFPQAQWVTYDPLSHRNEVDGALIAFGERLQPQYDFGKAEVILSLDSDFLGADAPALSAIRGFSRGRRVESEADNMSRLYVAESGFSITGAMADHRFRVKSSAIPGYLAAMAAAEDSGAEWTGPVKRDLEAHAGRCLVIAGPRQPAAVHALAYMLNDSLGNIGQTVTFTLPPVSPTEKSIGDLGEAMGSGQVKTLVILGGNPKYCAPADSGFGENLGQVKTVIHLGLDVDETAAAAHWHLPAAHYLEAWGDGRALDGTATIQQPLLQPLYDGKTPAELLAVLGGYKDQRGFDIVHSYWIAQFSGPDAEKVWRKALHEGFVAGSAFAGQNPVLRRDDVLQAAGNVDAGEGLEITFHQSATLYDGSFANNGWMQEAPDPMTKLTWDNAALISPATAARLGVETGDVVRIDSGGRAVEIAAMVMPGQADDSIGLELGYGRTEIGPIGQGAGQDVYPLRTTGGMGFATGVTVSKTGRRYKLVTTQEHHSMEGRPLVREASLEHYREEPDFVDHAVHMPELESLYKHPELTGEYQWGMAIDLNQCTGCNACLLACQAENNIPIVGKEEVARGREMHWIRLDRYFTGSEEEPEAVFQPVACQQCENAPCENVCPVAATNHSPEGLNDMVYNRCVGTRYCSNNCPYKVRRFNFLDWHGEVAEVSKMVFNPDVTVRMRGVMEKCTYCVQRIQEKKIQAKAEGRRKIADGEIVTACQQTCPAEAITFGNVADPNSRVSKIKQQNRDYAMLGELNVKPRTTFQAKLRNPNPELAPAPSEGHGEHASSPFRILNGVEG
jgi:molybdopterin-containing oxidoreductase family iron-sulfur binding subunit